MTADPTVLLQVKKVVLLRIRLIRIEIATLNKYWGIEKRRSLCTFYRAMPCVNNRKVD